MFKMQVLTQDEFLDEAARRFGPILNWKFVCPACGTIQSVQQFLDAGVAKDQIDSIIGFSCIGRFTGQTDAGIIAHNHKKPWTKGCNWTLGGLLKLHKLEVVIGDYRRPTFELAESDAT